MKRRVRILLIVLAVSVAFSAYQWLRPYHFGADPAAGAVIEYAALEKDHSFHWLTLRVALSGKAPFDLSQPIFLQTSANRRLEADVTTEGSETNGVSALLMKFWLEPGDLDGPLVLHLNQHRLTVRQRSSAPPDRPGVRVFTTSRW